MAQDEASRAIEAVFRIERARLIAGLARITRDIGLGAITLFGVIISIFVGVNLVYKELDRKTIFSLVPKPVRRYEFILGKFIGMVMTLVVMLSIMGVVLELVLLIQHGGFDGNMVRAFVLLFIEIMVVTAVAVLFSSFTSPFLSGLFTLGLYIVGTSTPEIRQLLTKLEEPMRFMFSIVLRVAPDLHLFFVSGSMLDGRHMSVNDTYVDWSYVALAGGYGLFYSACVLLIASFVFSRRDFI